jgi:glutaredoxin-like protein NrdH
MMTSKALEKRGLEHLKVDVTENPEAAEYVKSLGYTQAPVVVVGDNHHWSGFRPDKINGLMPARESVATTGQVFEARHEPPPITPERAPSIGY